MLVFIFAIVIGVLCAKACADIAGKKGYSAGLFGALGFFFGLIGLLIAAVLPDKS